jgi:hypothetical protein
LSRAKASPKDSASIINALKEKYHDILQNVTKTDTPKSAQFDEWLALYKENTEYLKKEIRDKLEKLEASLLKLTEYTERIEAQSRNFDNQENMRKLVALVQELTAKANETNQATKDKLRREKENREGS